MKMTRMQMQQYIKDLKTVCKRQNKIIQRQKVAITNIDTVTRIIDVHNAMVTRIIKQTLINDDTDRLALMPLTDRMPSTESD